MSHQPSDLIVLKETLDDVADRVVARSPLRADVDRSLRRVRSRRRLVRTGQSVGAVLAVAGLLGGVQVLGVPLPTWAPAVGIGQPASALADLPTRGSLAADTAWLRGLREKVATFDRSETGGERWRAPSPDAVAVLFAGDVGDLRIALVETPLRWGAIEDRAQIWYLGARGADASAMEESGNDSPSAVASATFGPGGLVETSGYVTVVVGSPGLAVEQVGPPVVDRLGRLDWPVAPATAAGDGAWVSTGTATSGRAFLRWQGGDPLPVGPSGWDTPSGEAAAALADEVLPAERTAGQAPSVVPAVPGTDRVVMSAEGAAFASGVTRTGIVRRLVWSGTLDGTPTDVVRVTTPSGGGVLVALGAFGEPLLRPMAAVPVGADAAPALAWSYQGVLSTSTSSPSPTETTTRFGGAAHVGLVGPVTAASARVKRDGGDSVTVPLVRGVGGAAVEGAATVEFLDERGQVIALALVQQYRPGDDATLRPPKAG